MFDAIRKGAKKAWDSLASFGKHVGTCIYNFAYYTFGGFKHLISGIFNAVYIFAKATLAALVVGIIAFAFMSSSIFSTLKNSLYAAGNSFKLAAKSLIGINVNKEGIIKHSDMAESKDKKLTPEVKAKHQKQDKAGGNHQTGPVVIDRPDDVVTTSISDLLGMAWKISEKMTKATNEDKKNNKDGVKDELYDGYKMGQTFLKMFKNMRRSSPPATTRRSTVEIEEIVESPTTPPALLDLEIMEERSAETSNNNHMEESSAEETSNLNLNI